MAPISKALSDDLAPLIREYVQAQDEIAERQQLLKAIEDEVRSTCVEQKASALLDEGFTVAGSYVRLQSGVAQVLNFDALLALGVTHEMLDSCLSTEEVEPHLMVLSLMEWKMRLGPLRK